jgi:hypothetical protein
MATAANGHESAEQTPEAPGAPTDPQRPSGRSPETRHEAHTPHASHADDETARQKIAALLWWSVPAGTDEEAKERTEQLLNDFAAEVLAGNSAAVAERDCLALAVLFALQWKPDTPMGLREGIERILATMPAATGTSSLKADATPDLDSFEAVISTSDGSYGAAEEYRCRKCGAIGAQGTDPKSLADLTAMAAQHKCLPRFDGGTA